MLVLVVLIAPSIGGMVAQVGGAPQGTPSPSPTTPATPQGGTSPGVVGGLTSGLAAGLGALSMLAIWGVLIVGVLLLVLRLSDTPSGPGGRAEDEAIAAAASLRGR